ncbi:MAG: hypothetical protein ACRDZO_11090 [Egibacteraceae bacterium]
MRIEIHLDQMEPPAGHAYLCTDGTAAPVVTFAGWLGLLRAL